MCSEKVRTTDNDCVSIKIDISFQVKIVFIYLYKYLYYIEYISICYAYSKITPSNIFKKSLKTQMYSFLSLNNYPI